MAIKNELNKLKEYDINSIILFSLYKLIGNPEYEVLSEMSYVLDRKNMLRFIEMFGGMTIRVPTISELETVTCGLLLYQLVNVEGKDYATSLNEVRELRPNAKNIQSAYESICNVIQNYTFDTNKYTLQSVMDK
jgi:hypothetical protein